jgi:uncharacterized Zn-binding protein involved in type VI secretion
MPFIAKIGDLTADGGIITGPGWPNVTINGAALTKPGDSITPHACCGAPGCDIHCVSKVLAQRMIGRITVNGAPLVVFGDLPTCGVPIAMQGIPAMATAGP